MAEAVWRFPAIIPRDALLSQACAIEASAAVTAMHGADIETARLLRAVAAEPHRILADPELRRVHDRMSPQHRAIFLALAAASGDVVTYPALSEAAWGKRQPHDAGHALRHAVCRMKPLLPPGMTIECRHRVGYRLVQNG